MLVKEAQPCTIFIIFRSESAQNYIPIEKLYFEGVDMQPLSKLGYFAVIKWKKHMKKYLGIALIFIFGFLIGPFLFYWYQLRPAAIKHECSWVKKHTDAIPAKVGMTEEQLKEKGMIKTCPPFPTNNPNSSAFDALSDPNNAISCIYNNDDVINANRQQKYVPAKDWYEAATKEEYAFCLHDKGL